MRGLLDPFLRKLRFLIRREVRQPLSGKNFKLAQQFDRSHRRALELEYAIFENGPIPAPVPAVVNQKARIERTVNKVTFIENDDGSVFVTAFNGLQFDPPLRGILMGPFSTSEDAHS